ncbi:MAG: 3-hydroxyacyl-ACP dehydratase FabZ family protein [Nitrospirota bacterium]
MDKVLEYHDLKKYVPHRYPFLLIDRVLDYEINKSIKGIKNISPYEPYLKKGDRTFYPIGLIMESIGQLAGILFSLSSGNARSKKVLIGSFSDVSIKGQVTVGNQLYIEVNIIKAMDNSFIAEGRAQCAKEEVLSIKQLIVIIK